jgi:putative transposase
MKPQDQDLMRKIDELYTDDPSRGFMYLVVVMDWYSRKILSWRVSNTMESDFCVQALQEALSQFGQPDIFNTD